MKRAFWPVYSIVMCGLLGCGSDVRESLVVMAVKQVGDAATNLGNIKENVEKWEKETKDPEKARHIKTAIEATERLKRNGQTLQEIKQEAAKLDPISPEEKEELGKNFRKRLQTDVDRLSKEMNALNQTMARAEKASKSGIADLKQKLQVAQSEFEVLTRR